MMFRLLRNKTNSITPYVDDISLVQIGKDSVETTPILEERTRIQIERASKLGLSSPIKANPSTRSDF
jgi:hypothetical protein